MKTQLAQRLGTLLLFLGALPAHAQLRENWHIKKNYDTLPCMSIQQTQALKGAREDGVDSVVKEADIFHEKTKAFFKKNKKFICPPVVEHEPKAEAPALSIPMGEANAFEEIYVVYPWQMEIQTGTSKTEIWKVNFSEESGVGFGKTKKLKNEFTMVPLIPRDEKSLFMIHSMKIPGHEKELIRVCYPPKLKKECNPYKELEEKPKF